MTGHRYRNFTLVALAAATLAACAPHPRSTAGEVLRDERGQPILTAPR